MDAGRPWRARCQRTQSAQGRAGRDRNPIDRRRRMTTPDEGRIASLEARNSELQRLLSLARDQLGEMKEKLAEASAPPQTFATFVAWAGKHADVVANGRRMRVAVLPTLEREINVGD